VEKARSQKEELWNKGGVAALWKKSPRGEKEKPTLERRSFNRTTFKTKFNSANLKKRPSCDCLQDNQTRVKGSNKALDQETTVPEHVA